MTLASLHRLTVLVLNRHWLPVGTITPIDAFGHLSAGTARAVLIDGAQVQPFAWDDWRGLPTGDGATVIGTPRGPVRIPAVIVLGRYDRVPMVTPKFGFEGLWFRDGGRCQYSGRRLERHEANIDHVLPRSRGGADTWENCVIADRRINTRKGAKTPAEAGLTLLRLPVAPRPMPAFVAIRNFWKVPEWDPFLAAPARLTST